MSKQGVQGQAALPLKGRQCLKVWVACSGQHGCSSHSCALISSHQKSELDKWAVAMNAEFEAAEQFELLIE